MLRFRTAPHASTAVIVAVQGLIGVGGGFVKVPTQLWIQASVGDGDVACATAVFQTTVSLGGAVLSGLLRAKLAAYLPRENLDALDHILGDFTVAKAPPSAARDAVGRAYDETMRTLLVIALCVCAPMWPMALWMKGLKLREVETEDRSVIIGGGSGRKEREGEGQLEGGDELRRKL
jgi:hypothetical protein